MSQWYVCPGRNHQIAITASHFAMNEDSEIDAQILKDAQDHTQGK